MAGEFPSHFAPLISPAQVVPVKSFLTIIIIDDDEGHALLMQQNLEEAGLTNRVMHLCDGQAALDFFFDSRDVASSRAAGSYLILLDIRMPKVDGIEVLRRLKLDPLFKLLPVIMLSTGIDPRDVERCHVLGCSAYVQKPVDHEDFSAAMHDVGRFAELLEIPEMAGR